MAILYKILGLFKNKFINKFFFGVYFSNIIVLFKININHIFIFSWLLFYT